MHSDLMHFSFSFFFSCWPFQNFGKIHWIWDDFRNVFLRIILNNICLYKLLDRILFRLILVKMKVIWLPQLCVTSPNSKVLIRSFCWLRMLPIRNIWVSHLKHQKCCFVQSFVILESSQCRKLVCMLSLSIVWILMAQKFILVSNAK